MQTPVALNFLQVTVTLMEEASLSMLQHRNDSYPNEAVGILCSDGVTFPLINQSRSPHRFNVSQTLVEEALETLTRRGHSPVAMYHSHPEADSSPSNRDLAMMETMPGSLSIIVGIDSIAAWRWNDGLESVGKIPHPERSML